MPVMLVSHILSTMLHNFPYNTLSSGSVPQVQIRYLINALKTHT